MTFYLGEKLWAPVSGTGGTDPSRSSPSALGRATQGPCGPGSGTGNVAEEGLWPGRAVCPPPAEREAGGEGAYEDGGEGGKTQTLALSGLGCPRGGQRQKGMHFRGEVSGKCHLKPTPGTWES